MAPMCQCAQRPFVHAGPEVLVEQHAASKTRLPIQAREKFLLMLLGRTIFCQARCVKYRPKIIQH